MAVKRGALALATAAIAGVYAVPMLTSLATTATGPAHAGGAARSHQAVGRMVGPVRDASLSVTMQHWRVA